MIHQKEEKLKKSFFRFILAALVLNCSTFINAQDLPFEGIIPFELNEHLIIIKGRINSSQKTYNFLLDTGALTYIDEDVVQELGLKTKGNMAKLNTLEMEEVLIPNIFAFMGFNLDEFKKLGITLHGIIGSNLLERFKVKIDYRKQRVILSSEKKSTEDGDSGFKSKFINHPVNNAPMIDCTVNGNTAIKAMVDTGQPYPIVFPLSYLDKLNAKNSPCLIKSKGIIIKWPDTSTIDSYLWRISLFEQGNLKINNLLCCFAELPRLLSVPLLGKDYLSQFLITIDYPHHEILMEPYENAQFIENLFSFGLNLGRGEHDTVVVYGLWTGGPADQAGIEIGDEIVECNLISCKGENISQLRQIIKNNTIKTIEFVIKTKEGRRKISLNKTLLLSDW